MKKEYTPGPWHFYRMMLRNGLKSIAHFAILPDRANQRLIAKAPEMAETLEAVLPYLKQCNISGCHIVADEIEKIIHEIEGGA